MSDVIGLGYIGLAVSDLERWERFGVDLVGMQLASREPGKRLTFRMDDYALTDPFARTHRFSSP